MADIRIHNTIDPFGQALTGYREGVKDYYDRALKEVQLASAMQKMRLASSSNARAEQTHKYNQLIASERLQTLQTTNKYLAPYLGQRNALGETKLRGAQGEEEVAAARRPFEQRDAEYMHWLEMEGAKVKIDALGKKGAAASEALVRKPAILLAPRAAPSTLPGITVAPGGPSKLGAPPFNPFAPTVDDLADSGAGTKNKRAAPAPQNEMERPSLLNVHSNFNAAGEFTKPGAADDDEDEDFNSSGMWE